MSCPEHSEALGLLVRFGIGHPEWTDEEIEAEVARVAREISRVFVPLLKAFKERYPALFEGEDR